MSISATAATPLAETQHFQRMESPATRPQERMARAIRTVEAAAAPGVAHAGDVAQRVTQVVKLLLYRGTSLIRPPPPRTLL